MRRSRRVKTESCYSNSEDEESSPSNSENEESSPSTSDDAEGSPSNSDDAESAASSASDTKESYEILRERQIQENRDLLELLGLAPHQAPIAGPARHHPIVKREVKPTLVAELRRNSRRQSRSEFIVYNGGILKARTSTGEFLTHRPERQPPPPSIIYGHIPGVPVLRTWDYRHHIGSMHDGGLRVRTTSDHPAASLCFYTMSAGANTAWQDSLDFGDHFTFITAYGNFTFEDNQRSGQVRHQTYEHQVHKSLLLNVAHGVEVRVIRGSKSSSCWAPEEGEFRSDLLLDCRRFFT